MRSTSPWLYAASTTRKHGSLYMYLLRLDTDVAYAQRFQKHG